MPEASVVEPPHRLWVGLVLITPQDDATRWRNDMKDRSENRKVGSPARALGFVKQPLRLRDILDRRLFPDRAETVQGWLRECYFGRIRTRVIAPCVEHRARYAK